MSIPVHSSNLLHRMLRMSVGTNGGPMLGREGLGAPQCDGRQGLRRPPRHRRRRCRSWSEAARAPPSPVMWLPQVGSSHRFFVWSDDLRVRLSVGEIWGESPSDQLLTGFFLCDLTSSETPVNMSCFKSSENRAMDRPWHIADLVGAMGE